MPGYKSRKKNRYKKNRINRREKAFRYIHSGLIVCGTLAAVMMLSFLFIFGYAFLTQHPYFGIERIYVGGMDRLSGNAVIQQTGIKEGDNIFSVNLGTVRKRLLAHPLIADARIRRIIPSQIELVVREHQPLAILDLGRKFTINAQGMIYKEADPLNPEKLPVITGLGFTDIHVPGQSASAAFKAVMEVLRLGQNMASIVPNQVIRSIRVDHDMGLTLHMGHSIKTIKLGYDNYKTKYERLKNILRYLKIKPEFSDLDLVDLKNLNRIIVHPSGNKPPADSQKEV